MAAGAAPDPNARPLSPHLQIWRWHATMAASILHRVTGVGLYLGAVGLVIWLVALAAGEQAYAPLQTLFQSWFGQLKLYALFGVLAYHAANGIRHLIWDTGRHLDPKAANATAWLVIAFAFAAPVALFLLLRASP